MAEIGEIKKIIKGTPRPFRAPLAPEVEPVEAPIVIPERELVPVRTPEPAKKG